MVPCFPNPLILWCNRDMLLPLSICISILKIFLSFAYCNLALVVSRFHKYLPSNMSIHHIHTCCKTWNIRSHIKGNHSLSSLLGKASEPCIRFYFRRKTKHSKKKKNEKPPLASSSIFNMDRGPKVVRIMSATAYIQKHKIIFRKGSFHHKYPNIWKHYFSSFT